MNYSMKELFLEQLDELHEQLAAIDEVAQSDSAIQMIESSTPFEVARQAQMIANEIALCGQQFVDTIREQAQLQNIGQEVH